MPHVRRIGVSMLRGPGGRSQTPQPRLGLGGADGNRGSGDRQAVFELRGFDLVYARRVFPGYVLEREDTREDYGEPRFRVIGEVLQGHRQLVGLRSR